MSVCVDWSKSVVLFCMVSGLSEFLLCSVFGPQMQLGTSVLLSLSSRRQKPHEAVRKWPQEPLKLLHVASSGWRSRFSSSHRLSRENSLIPTNRKVQMGFTLLEDKKQKLLNLDISSKWRMGADGSGLLHGDRKNMFCWCSSHPASRCGDNITNTQQRTSGCWNVRLDI